jgi:hypothetical protein
MEFKFSGVKELGSERLPDGLLIYFPETLLHF